MKMMANPTFAPVFFEVEKLHNGRPIKQASAGVASQPDSQKCYQSPSFYEKAPILNEARMTKKTQCF